MAFVCETEVPARSVTPLKVVYGAAAPHLQAYLDLIDDAFLRSGQRLSTFQTDHSYLTLEVMNQATRHFREAAQAVAADPALARRVRRERLPLGRRPQIHVLPQLS